MNKMFKGKAPGFDLITSEHIIHAGPGIVFF